MLFPGKYGIYDLSECVVSQHARGRFAERFGVDFSDESIPEQLARGLKRCRRLGTNPENGAVAYFLLVGDVPCVVLLQAKTVLTFLKLEQFETVMASFGRMRWPGKLRRWVRRIEGE